MLILLHNNLVMQVLSSIVTCILFNTMYTHFTILTPPINQTSKIQQYLHSSGDSLLRLCCPCEVRLVLRSRLLLLPLWLLLGILVLRPWLLLPLSRSGLLQWKELRWHNGYLGGRLGRLKIQELNNSTPFVVSCVSEW